MWSIVLECVNCLLSLRSEAEETDLVEEGKRSPKAKERPGVGVRQELKVQASLVPPGTSRQVSRDSGVSSGLAYLSTEVLQALLPAFVCIMVITHTCASTLTPPGC